ncbi:MAG TPA: cellulase family glycosylhydrolase [Chitinophagaceae bacterium]
MKPDPRPAAQISTDNIFLPWSEEKANAWYDRHGWVVGCNYIPSTAINQLEMWQAETYDPATIETELAWAHEIGFNTIRVFLHHLLWEQDKAGFLGRLDDFLGIADANNIKTMFVLFDAVWDPYPKLGKQPDPKRGVHNSGWVQSPGADILKNENAYHQLQDYVEGVIGRFKDDDRVLIWDLFNEPDNMNQASYNDSNYGTDKAELSLQLLKKTIGWARTIAPCQPLTAAPWQYDWSERDKLTPLDNYMFSQSDVITFHCYENSQKIENRIIGLQQFNRPILCTEYMARHNGSTFEEVLPVLKKYNVGAYNWGFVAGKTQTHYPWDSWNQDYLNEPEVWFHDIFRPSGEPYSEREVDVIKKLCKRPEPDIFYQEVA